MALARTYSVALVGVEGHLIDVEADIAQGLPATILVGLPDTALREARDRIRAAIANSGERWPQAKITVGLSPASLPKRGSGFDLAIAVAILAAAGGLPLSSPTGKMFLAELGLDGRLRPVPGVLPAVVAAEPSVDTVVVAAANLTEARLVPGVRVVAASSLAEVAIWLGGGPAPTPPPAPVRPRGSAAALAKAPKLDLAEVLGQSEARMAAEICAAGGHNLSLLGPPGAGKTMLAERLPTILPRLEPAAALEVTSIHSVAGTLPPGAGLLTEPPFCAPHHTASKAAIVGGGSGIIRPGAASLAHRGVLFLDEAPEFGRDVLDALRQPLEAGEVVIARSAMCARFPARFTLVLAANPCPCAKAASAGGAGCACSPAARRRYLGRLSGPLLDRVDVKVRLQPASRREMLYDSKHA
jgi:magnesium chelatase family protein